MLLHLSEIFNTPNSIVVSVNIPRGIYICFIVEDYSFWKSFIILLLTQNPLNKYLSFLMIYYYQFLNQLNFVGVYMKTFFSIR